MTPNATATIHHAEGVRFDDVQALDEELLGQQGGSLAALYGAAALLPDWKGPFVVDADGELLIADSASEKRVRYGSTTAVGPHWSRQVTEAIARRLVHGELVIEIHEEDQPYEYLVITPGAFDVRDEF